MRILFRFVGAHGHFEPLVPIARAAYVAGHTVAFVCAASMVSTHEAAVFTVFAMGTGPSRPAERIPLRPRDRRREDRDLQDEIATPPELADAVRLLERPAAEKRPLYSA